MKKILLAIVAVLGLTTNASAQKFLDIYSNGKIVSSIKAADVDSMVVSGEADGRSLDFFHNGEAFHHTLTANVDSIKVFRTGDDPLVYMGIVGFNQELYKKEFGVLGRNSAGGFKSFVSNLTRKDGTLLYYGIDEALNMLLSASFPTRASSVNLITFTDGLDQGSLMMNGNYTTDEQYLNAVSSRIGSTTVKGLPLTAYSLGLRGSDVTNYELFQNNLKKLASSPEKAFEVSSMSDVRSRLQGIADQIISISNKQNISMKIPGQSNGTLVRFTFDGYSAANSSLYIEGTFNLSDRSLRNVVYHGLKAESGSVIQGRQNGIFVTYDFTGLQREDGNGLVPTGNIRQYYKSATATSWQENSEFTPDNNTQTTVSHSGAIILLVLDCSSSLGSQFSNMQSYANDFIDRVASNTAGYLERPFGNRPKLVHGEAVDLGLPSGTLWASCNVGASKPEDYGLYFAWGETVGYTSDTSDGHSFNWGNYKWCAGAYDELTKYSDNSSYGNNGFTDNKTELDLADDAAYVNWGSQWRMPSRAQQDELRAQCTWTWTQLNGVNGYRVTSKTNGNSIFLPTAGERSDTSLYSAGSKGYYLSRTLSTYGPNDAYNLYFRSGLVDWDGRNRCRGQVVRPVRR